MNLISEQDLSKHQAIKRMLDAWGLFRDTCRFEELRDCYAPQATMVTTWFDGLASDFVDASVRASASKTLVQHFFGASTIEVKGSRAIAETRLMILVRMEFEETEVDVTCYGRFYDRIVREKNVWRILSRIPIYEKDSIAPVDSGVTVKLDPERLASFPTAFRHLAYLQASGGATITKSIPSHNGQAQQALYAAGEAWLREGIES